MEQAHDSDESSGEADPPPRGKDPKGKGNLKRGSSSSSSSSSSEASQERDKQKGAKKRAVPHEPMNFPRRLMDLLRRNERPDAIYWLPDGKMFAMHTGLIDDVLSINFQGAKFGSFTRTLNKCR